jgi:hypothetical protein
MTSLRLQEVLSIGVQNAAGKRERSGASSATITDENDPLFLLAAKAALDNALTNLVDPPNPSAAWDELVECECGVCVLDMVSKNVNYSPAILTVEGTAGKHTCTPTHCYSSRQLRGNGIWVGEPHASQKKG